MKYKLIKTYPGSPKLGTEALPLEDIYWYKDNMGCSQTLRNIKAYPEYWQEIIERDYEILSFIGSIKSPCNGEIAYKCKNGQYSMSRNSELGTTSEETMFKLNYNIYSIKRLSDGEIFTVGDKVEHFFDSKNNSNELKKIILVTDPYSQVVSYFHDDSLNSLMLYVDNNNANLPLKWAKKIKQPLFTTEDGVEVLDPDQEIYKVFNNYSLSKQKAKNANSLIEDYKRFSTKQIAEEYIIMNKPCLSIRDISNIYHTTYPHAGKIRNLVKHKLGL